VYTTVRLVTVYWQNLNNETLLHIDAENRRQTLEEELKFLKSRHRQVNIHVTLRYVVVVFVVDPNRAVSRKKISEGVLGTRRRRRRGRDETETPNASSGVGNGEGVSPSPAD